MPGRVAIRLALLVCFNVTSLVQLLVAQAQPPIDPAYHKYLLHYVDKRSIPEKLLNTVGLSYQDVGPSFAMIVGVANYPQLSDGDHTLKPANRDIDLLFDYLKNQQLFDEIVVLRDDGVTFDNLRYFLETYFPSRMKSSQHSRFIFAYSGHGMTEGEHGFLLTTAARNLSDKQNSIDMEVLRTFSQHTIEAGYQSLFLINACHSGAFSGKQREGPWEYILKRPGAHAISSAGAKDSSWGENDKGSYFYQKFIEGLNGKADPNGRGIITVADLGAYLHTEVGLATGGRQVPTLPQDIWTGMSDGGVFFFNREKAVRIADLPVWDPRRVVPFGPDPSLTTNVSSGHTPTISSKVPLLAARIEKTDPEEEAIAGVVASYQKAYNLKDKQGLLKEWPHPSRDQLKEIEQLFRSRGGESLEIKCGDAIVTGAQATKYCTQELTYNVDNGPHAPVTGKITFTFVKQNGRWLIDKREAN